MAIISNVGTETQTEGSSSSSSPNAAQKRVEETLSKAVEYKKHGNEAFSNGDSRVAMQAWHLGLTHSAGINSFASMYGSQSTASQNIKAQELSNAFRLNLAACYIKEGKWDKGVYATSKVLESDPTNLKALYRRSLSLLRQGDLRGAAQDLDKALDRAPNDPAIRKLAAELVEREEDRVGKGEEEAAREAEEKEKLNKAQDEAQNLDN